MKTLLKRAYLTFMLDTQEKVIAQAELSLSYQIQSLSAQRDVARSRAEALRAEIAALNGATNPTSESEKHP